MTDDQHLPFTLADLVADRIRDLSDRKSLTQISHDAGLRSTKLLTMICTGDAKLPLDRVADLARALDLDAEELMRLALPQFMEERAVRLVLAAGAADLKRELDRAGTFLIAIATNMRIALDSLDRTAGAAQTLTELAGADFERVDKLRIEIEKRMTAMIGYPVKTPREPNAG